jgi:hypothetical protein
MEQLKATVSNEFSGNSLPTNLADARRYARLLLGCYRAGDANDPEVYVAAVVAVLSNFPTDIVRSVCDPVRGLPSQTKWLPTVAEVVEACNKIADHDRRNIERQRQINRQLAERRALPPPPNKYQSRGRVVTYEQAQKLMEENRGVRIIGVFDQGRTVPYRG